MITKDCPQCKGIGSLRSGSYACEYCNRTGQVIDIDMLEAKIATLDIKETVDE